MKAQLTLVGVLAGRDCEVEVEILKSSTRSLVVQASEPLPVPHPFQLTRWHFSYVPPGTVAVLRDRLDRSVTCKVAKGYGARLSLRVAVFSGGGDT